MFLMLSCSCFFFSSRRRHTRYIGDWSSDVCSSDLTTPSADIQRAVNVAGNGETVHIKTGSYTGNVNTTTKNLTLDVGGSPGRSEERRVGKECRTRGSRDL